MSSPTNTDERPPDTIPEKKPAHTPTRTSLGSEAEQNMFQMEAEGHFGATASAFATLTDEDLLNMEEIERALGVRDSRSESYASDIFESIDSSGAKDFCVCCFGGSCGANEGNSNFVHKEEYATVMKEIDEAPQTPPRPTQSADRSSGFDEPAPYCPEGPGCPKKKKGCAFNHPDVVNCRSGGDCSRDGCMFNHPAGWINERLPAEENSPSVSSFQPRIRPPPMTGRGREGEGGGDRDRAREDYNSHNYGHSHQYPQQHGYGQQQYGYGAGNGGYQPNHGSFNPYAATFQMESGGAGSAAYTADASSEQSAMCETEATTGRCAYKSRGCVMNHMSMAECRHAWNCTREDCQFNHPWQWVFSQLGWDQ